MSTSLVCYPESAVAGSRTPAAAVATGLSEPQAIASTPSSTYPPIVPGTSTIYPITCFPSLLSTTTGYTLEVLVSICERFLPLLPSNKVWEPVNASRYGVARPDRLSFPTSAIPGVSADPVLSLAERMLAFNRYLLDGFVLQGLPCAYQKQIPTENIYFTPLSSSTAKLAIREVVRSCIHLRLEQYFHDGNHRTSTLLLFEHLRLCNVAITAPPLHVYLFLGLAEDLKAEPAIELLVRFLERHSIFGATEIPTEYRATIKEIPILATQAYLVHDALFNGLADLGRRRSAYRWLKIRYPVIFQAVAIIATSGKSKTFRVTH